MDFSYFFSLQNFKSIINYYNDSSKNSNDDIIEKNFNIPLINFLTTYRNENGLSKIENAEGHFTRISKSWNKFTEKKEKERDLEYIAEIFYKLPSNATIVLDSNSTNEQIIDAYNKFTNKITKGDIHYYDTREDFCQCSECGQRFKLKITEWEPFFGVLGLDRTKGLQTPPSCIENKIIEYNIDFPTGELLIQDWFRIDGFNDLVSYNEKDKYSDEKSINFTKGRIFATQYLLENFNIVSISVGNSSPQIFKKKNELIFGRLDEDETETENITNINKKNEFKEKGMVCTDLWNATIVDKKNLIDILAKKVGEDKANELVTEYINEDHFGLNIIKVKPGNYTLKYHGNYHKFNELYQGDNIPKDIEKFFTLYKNELVLYKDKKHKIK